MKVKIGEIIKALEKDREDSTKTAIQDTLIASAIDRLMILSPENVFHVQPIVTPCPYCHNAPRQKNLILTPTEDIFIRIVYMEGNKLVLEDRNMIKKVKIKYCSMCGRKL